MAVADWLLDLKEMTVTRGEGMHRQPEHVMIFLLAEIGTNGSLDGQQGLVVKGRFAPKNFEGILRRCINEYCHMQWLQKSRYNSFRRESSLLSECGSGQSVAPIKAGFVARVWASEGWGMIGLSCTPHC
ncbi:eukaryotic translation initiation factor 2 subunit beta-like [Actinidia eriantha]|uniref:eukaryotic translation initiation factor 2 subunit beta-like n=1 Tax=Actinidia eriantha TaxID=165200 RepID=UPI00258777EE|nr:eukaryotic translation initiation factor 2 subunit beta-like [Actinidia eriantha]